MFGSQISPVDELRRLRHDLASPVTAIYCLTQDLLKNNTSRKSNHNQLQLILTAAHDLTQQLTCRHHPQTFVHHQQFALCPFLRQFQVNGGYPYPVEIKVYVADLKGCTLYGNPYHLKNALNHIITNACEAYPPACCKRLIKIYARPHFKGVLITIHDWGKGMSWWQKALASKKNISFKKVKSGLGLWEAQQIIMSEFGGSLRVHSQKNTGTALSVHLPL